MQARRSEYDVDRLVLEARIPATSVLEQGRRRFSGVGSEIGDASSGNGMLIAKVDVAEEAGWCSNGRSDVRIGQDGERFGEILVGGTLQSCRVVQVFDMSCLS